jgi:hypothetical protein
VNDHDDFLIDLLKRRLMLVDGKYVWPRSVRSAMLFWQVDSELQKKIKYQIAKPNE